MLGHLYMRGAEKAILKDKQAGMNQIVCLLLKLGIIAALI